MTRIGVLGGGIQGSCIALALAQNGCRVVLFEREATCLTGASGNSEGKIHLGFVYGQDPSRRSGKMMARGGLSFAPLLKRWLGDDKFLTTSDPFRYAVMRDSILSVEEVEEYLWFVSACLNDELERDGADYFGLDIRQPIRRLSETEMEMEFDPTSVAAAYTTPEIAVDPLRVANRIRAAIQEEPLIELRNQTVVEAVEPDPMRPAVVFSKGEERGRERFDHLVNALWDGRLAVDITAGIKPARPWTFRLKYGLRLKTNGIDRQVRSTTLILGPFGDVVNYGDGDYYLSWYPAGRLAISSQIEPEPWSAQPSETICQQIRAKSIAGLATAITSVHAFSEHHLTSCRCVGGQIFAWGATDVNDPFSELHRRHDIGVNSYGRYHSVDTGKYTMAPFFAAELAHRIVGTAA